MGAEEEEGEEEGIERGVKQGRWEEQTTIDGPTTDSKRCMRSKIVLHYTILILTLGIRELWFWLRY